MSSRSSGDVSSACTLVRRQTKPAQQQTTVFYINHSALSLSLSPAHSLALCWRLMKGWEEGKTAPFKHV